MDFGAAFSRMGNPEAESQCERGHAAMGARDWARAMACFEACCEIDPSSKVYLLARGRAYDAAGRAAEAIASYRTALEVDPRFVGAIEGLRQHGVEVGDGVDKTFSMMPADAQAEIRKMLGMGVGADTIRLMYDCQPPSADDMAD
jgi:tetratricopeptide (TPR) repeat protein